MKKLVAIASGILGFGCLGAFGLPVTVDTSAAFSSEYILHGRMCGKKVFAALGELGAPFSGGRAYVGTRAVLGINGDQKSPIGVPATRNEVDPYAGISYDVFESLTVDVGYMHRFYTNLPTQREIEGDLSPLNQKRNMGEVYAGVTANVLLSPSVYFFYNYGSKEITIEGRATYTYDLGQFGISNTSVELGGRIGYDKANKPYGCKQYVSENMGKKDYVYYGTNADLVYHFAEHAEVHAGVAVEANNARKEDWPNQYFWHRSFIWFNASVDCSF
jgi:hypothetical protein